MKYLLCAGLFLCAFLAGCSSKVEKSIVGDWTDCYNVPSYQVTYGEPEKDLSLFEGVFKFYEDGTIFVENDDALTPAIGGEYKVLSQEKHAPADNHTGYTDGDMQIVISGTQNGNLLVNYTYGELTQGGEYLTLMTEGGLLPNFYYSLCRVNGDY